MLSQRMGLKLDMPVQKKRCTWVIFAVLLFCVSYGAATAAAKITLDEVTVSSDLKRVIMKASGLISHYNAFELDRPPRLVVDIAGTLPRKALKIPPPAQNGGLKIVVAESRAGTHVVLDFGGAPVPAHRIRRMKSYLIVFVDDWRPLRQTPESRQARRKPSTDRAPARSKQPAPKNFSQPEQEKKSDLTIQSAEVIDGLIVLKVADRTDPQRLYRIDLGVNFQKMGFVSAGIYPLTESAGWQLHPAGNHTEPAAATPRTGKIGPRKAAGPLTKETNSGVRNTGDVKRGPRAGPTKEALGGTRTPIRSGSVGPVSLRGNQDHGEGPLSRIPRQSVTATAWKLLNAYRQAPLVQTQRCGFSGQRSSRSFSVASDSKHPTRR